MWKFVMLSVFAALMNYGLAVCTLDDVGCCITEFTSMIQPSGITLTEQRVSSVCTFDDETVECLDLFMDQCSRNETGLKDVGDLVNRTKAYIKQICPPTSDFMTRLKENEICIMNASEKFQACYNRTLLPSTGDSDEEKIKKECCEYKALRNCVIQAVEDRCGATASQLVHEEVVHMNGAVLEWSCGEVFGKCENVAGMLASSALLVLYSVIFKFCLNNWGSF